MIHSMRLGRHLCIVTALAASTQMATAQNAFDAPAMFTARVSISGADRGPIYPDSTANIVGEGFAAGQSLSVERGDTVLVDDATADADGKFSASFDIPADAVVGVHPVIVKTDGPDSAKVIDVKVSPKLDYFGADKFDITKAQLGGGLYQVGISKSGDLFVTSAVGRPPVMESSIFKVNGKTLEVLAEGTPPAAPKMGDKDGGLFAVYGIGVDDAHGHVWVTNSRQNTVAVYAQSDLSLVKQFPAGTVSHPRDVVIDEATGRAYVSTMGDGIGVFDTDTLAALDPIIVSSRQRGQSFTPMSLALNGDGSALYTVSFGTPEVAKIDLASGDVSVMGVPGIARAIGVDVSEDGSKIFITSQNSDDVVVIDADGNPIVSKATGVQPLNVVYDDTDALTFVANRSSNSVAVMSLDGELVANLPGGPNPNFVEAADDGVVYLVNKGWNDGPDSNTLWRIDLK